MGRVVVVNHVTLDGVMQGPGDAEEDTRDGFTAGGWATARSDDVVGSEYGKWIGGAAAFLFGRRSYEGMLGAWNERGGPFQEGLNARQKYVASSSESTELAWPNSTLVSGDVPSAVAGLKRSEPGDLVIMGSGQLIRSLLVAELIDVFVLAIHPLVLGNGRRLFEEGCAATLKMLSFVQSPTGVVVATYEL